MGKECKHGTHERQMTLNKKQKVPWQTDTRDIMKAIMNLVQGWAIPGLEGRVLQVLYLTLGQHT